MEIGVGVRCNFICASLRDRGSTFEHENALLLSLGSETLNIHTTENKDVCIFTCDALSIKCNLSMSEFWLHALYEHAMGVQQDDCESRTETSGFI